MVYDALLVIALLMVAGALALPLTSGESQALRDPVYTVYLVSVWFAYCGGCWVLAGQTLGMRAWRVRLVDQQGQRPGWRAAALRFTAAWLSVLPAGLGFLSALWHPERLAWHDRLSRTRLVRVSGSN